MSRGRLLGEEETGLLSGSERYTLETTEGRMPLAAIVRRNLAPATTVAIVSISLSIALGIASGAGPQAGLSTAVWGGLTGGLFCSSPYNIIGPAGALAPMLNSYAVQWGPGILPWISLGSALVVFATYASGLQKYALFMPKAVFEGFTVAVAITIGLSQLPAAFGLTTAKHAHFMENLVESLRHLPEARLVPTAVFVPEALAMFFLLRAVPSVPWMAVVPLASLPLGWLGEQYEWGLPTLKSKYGALSPDLLSPPSPSVLSALAPEQFGGVLAAVCSVAAVAVLETLISAKIAADRAGNGFDEAHETRGLSLAHAACGLAGAMPPTGVFVRTNLNQTLGAVHRSSQFMQAALVGVVTAFAMPLFQFMPMPTIAALLVVAAARMLPWGFLRALRVHAPADLSLCLLTAALAVLSDMIVGLLVGTVVALLRNAAQTARAPNAVLYADASEEGAHLLVVRGPVTYLNAREVLARGLACPSAVSPGPHRALLDLSAVLVVDYEGLEAVHALLLALDKQAANGAHVKGPDGAEVPATALADKFELRRMLDTVAPAAVRVDNKPSPEQY